MKRFGEPVTSGVNSTETHRFEIRHFLAISATPGLHVEAWPPDRGRGENALRTSLSVAEFGRQTIPCKDLPSATTSGSCGLDKGLPPDSLATNRSTTTTVRSPNRRARASSQFQTGGFRRISDWR